MLALSQLLPAHSATAVSSPVGAAAASTAESATRQTAMACCTSAACARVNGLWAGRCTWSAAVSVFTHGGVERIVLDVAGQARSGGGRDALGGGGWGAGIADGLAPGLSCPWVPGALRRRGGGPQLAGFPRAALGAAARARSGRLVSYPVPARKHRIVLHLPDQAAAEAPGSSPPGL